MKLKALKELYKKITGEDLQVDTIAKAINALAQYYENQN